ncbi:MAG: UpxY family transcription antiterminator [Bacteroidota bacterium]|nr:UpxY family transcription antiterminator [Bacteroidota bacterium]
MKMQSDMLRWYAVYTAPRAEKKLSERFLAAGIEHYLPLKTVKHHWSDRVKEVSVPVINGYIFVQIGSADFIKVMKIYGAISFVKEGLTPAPIPDMQMDRFRRMVELSDRPVEFSNEQFDRGETVNICKGPLQGLMGELIEVQGKHKVIVRLQNMGCAMTIIPLSFVEKVTDRVLSIDS